MLDEIVTQDRETMTINQGKNELQVGDSSSSVSGEFTEFKGERYYLISNVDRMSPFFISLVSNSDHWLFISSNGGLTAGRVCPENALFPYVTVDKIHESTSHTGSKTLFRLDNGLVWEPFNKEHDGRYKITRNIYKNLLGNKLCFEEINHDLKLKFNYSWMSSDGFGFVRESELTSTSNHPMTVEVIDGLQNILPAGTPRSIQASSSNLVDAYKWNEYDETAGLAYYTLYSGITDRPEPHESMYANTVFHTGIEDVSNVLLSSQQLDNFRTGKKLQQESHTRGIRGAFLINATFQLEPRAAKEWMIVANVEQSQGQVVQLRRTLINNPEIRVSLKVSIEEGSDDLKSIMGGLDGFQVAAEENVTIHHYANVLFNGMRGGVFDDQYQIDSQDFVSHIIHFNNEVYKFHETLFDSFPKKLGLEQLHSLLATTSDSNLIRLGYEYLPLTFGRRHGDPSRPWNEFAIKLKDSDGKRLLNYQGNWRDIFQNWEALSLSYPQYIESFITKFVNASTIDGYNPYRITKEGIDWETEDPEDPWSYIGYWGDHQIIYLLKLLEHSNNFHPEKLGELLYQSIFAYANVPYRIKSFEDIIKDSKSTVEFDLELADKIEQRVNTFGADGKLLLDENDKVYLVNLIEKLLVPLLSKLSNLVIDGGIWLNTQRPEWNDANNAIVGQGLSMVTLYYLRRYVSFLQDLLKEESGTVDLSKEVNTWLGETCEVLQKASAFVVEESITNTRRYEVLQELGAAASTYRETIYKQECFGKKESQGLSKIKTLLDNALITIDHSIASNKSDNGLYHAYNLLNLQGDELKVDNLYSMLEGQVSALSSGAIAPKEAVNLLNVLFETNLYWPEQHSFILYPDRKLPSFLDKNQLSKLQFNSLPFLQKMLDDGYNNIVYMDVDGDYRFNANLINKGQLDNNLNELIEIYGEEIDSIRGPLQSIYEEVFNHKEFTGRSGGMFGFEGLGCIYWHMVSKLLLAVQEMYFEALGQDADSDTRNELGRQYYKVREGIGFNKTPLEYGAFPTDPYSHTPGYAGAQQPGMTGQVKEEILTRFGELGIRVSNGAASFQPKLLRECEFVTKAKPFEYLDVNDEWQEILIPKGALAFTWCQIPVVYQLNDSLSNLEIELENGKYETMDVLELSNELSNEIFVRSGCIKQIKLNITESSLFNG